MILEVEWHLIIVESIQQPCLHLDYVWVVAILIAVYLSSVNLVVSILIQVICEIVVKLLHVRLWFFFW